MSAALLEASGLRKSYGRIAVLHDVSLTIGADESHVVIGPNGAGKTTLFKVLTGELLADGGRVVFRGEDVSRLPAHKRVHRGFGRTFQVARVFGKLDVHARCLTKNLPAPTRRAPVRKVVVVRRRSEPSASIPAPSGSGWPCPTSAAPSPHR